MRRLALVTLVSMLALPGAAAARTRVYSARVVRANAGSLTVRLADGRIARYTSPRVTTAPSPRPLLAHAARASDTAGAADVDLGALEPGVKVLVTATSAGVTIALPAPGGPEQHEHGVVSAVQPDGFELQLPDHTRLRLHTAHRVALRSCQTVSVSYHQDLALLVADSIRRESGRRVRGCATRSAAGTITAISSSALTLAVGTSRSLTLAASSAVLAGFAVGDVVDVSYVRGRAIEVAHVHRLARGTVTGSGDGVVTISDGAGGSSVPFATGASVAPGEHVVVVYHRSGGRAVADALYAAAG